MQVLKKKLFFFIIIFIWYEGNRKFDRVPKCTIVPNHLGKHAVLLALALD